MKNRVMIDLFCIFGLGAVYFALIYLAAAYSLPENLGLTPEHGDTFAGDFSVLVVHCRGLFGIGGARLVCAG